MLISNEILLYNSTFGYFLVIGSFSKCRLIFLIDVIDHLKEWRKTGFKEKLEMDSRSSFCVEKCFAVNISIIIRMISIAYSNLFPFLQM
jgi:hypothetical protein